MLDRIDKDEFFPLRISSFCFEHVFSICMKVVLDLKVFVCGEEIPCPCTISMPNARVHFNGRNRGKIEETDFEQDLRTMIS